MRRPTVVLMTYSILGGGLMALAAGALAQAATSPAQPAGSHDAVLALLGPSASGVIGALVVACYNQITSFVKAFNARMDKLESSHQAVKAALDARPCMVDEPCVYQDPFDTDQPPPPRHVHHRGRA